MKKGLSVLLIVAALFGFYGGATSLNDILASKDYWEEVGEKSTADMNKLEDGLNQLKDNEQAYLDGQKTLAEGEKTLADGEAQYAQGLKDYADAPAKLADGEAQVAAGEKELAQGYADYAAAPGNLKALKTSMDNLKTARTAFNSQWKPGFEKKAGKADFSDAGLRQARGVITKKLNDSKDQIALIESVAGKSGLLNSINNAKTYAQFDKALLNMIDAFEKAAKTLQSFADLANQYAIDSRFSNLVAGLSDEKVAGMDLDTMKANYNALVEQDLDAQLKSAQDTLDQLEKAKAAGSKFVPGTEIPIDEGISKAKAGIKTLEGYIETRDGLGALIEGRNTAQSEVLKFSKNAGDKLDMVAKLSPELAKALSGSMTVIAANGGSTKNSDYATAVGTLQGALAKLAAALNEKVKEINTNKASLVAWDGGYNQLKAGQDQLASGLSSGFAAALANKNIRPVLDRKSPKLVSLMKLYRGNRLKNDDLDEFDSDMTTIANTVIPNLVSILGGIRAKGLKDYAAAPGKLADGEKKLAAGKAELAQGYADYAAAPAKLADAEKQLADGRKQLADGKAKLAEYEDGEQQVRDGLATLMATEADPGLESILERRNGDDKFDDANGHLELDKGLEAVETGRGYQADSGELITKEITNRAVGTAAGLAAGALAVLAAILSFLKKNKGAAVSGVLAAVAGGVGAGVGLSAGEYYSDIAGSTIGNTPFIAAAILAAVAAVFAIVHFTAKPEAK